MAYKLELLEAYALHLVFHVSLLKPYQKEPQDDERNISAWASTRMRNQYEKIAEEILAKRIKQGPTIEYLVKWKNKPLTETSWEPAESLWQFTKLIDVFEEEQTSRTMPHSGGGEWHNLEDSGSFYVEESSLAQLEILEFSRMS